MEGGRETARRAGRDMDRRVEAVRRFSRFYTQKIGVLQEKLLKSPFSLTEGRVIYELAQRESATASELAAELGLDPGYLSRILGGFRRRGLIHRERSQADGRQSLLRLTAQGQKAFAALNARSQGEIATMLGALPAAEQDRLVAALSTVETLMGARPARRAPYILRPHQPGDMGWVVHRHGALYAQEYGWDERFEALVAGVVAEFIDRFDPKRERCWIAEMEGEIVGAVLLVRKSATVAKLRLLLVEPKARGHGIGRRLIEECIRFARQAGYRKITLWTNSILLAARHLYEETGFRLVRQERHKSFGQDLVGETWELAL
jgi:DNA-binding MarR family transcriptional regulator/N-acetylglutamate synthase-like GNAT family acetyltransferase